MAGESPRKVEGALPTPRAELWLIASFAAAILRRFKRKERRRILRDWCNLLQAGGGPSIHRPDSELAEAMQGKAEALNWLDAAEPIIRSLCDL